MLCCARWLSIVVAGCWAVILAGNLQAAPTSEQLLPSTTKGYISIGDVDRFRADWDKTQIGQLLADPIMQPFVEDFKKQIAGRWNQTHQKLGITWDDLSGVPSGEVALAIILPSKTEAAMVLIADVAGRKEQTARLLEKIGKNMTALHKAKASEIEVAGSRVTSYVVPKDEHHPARNAYIVVKEDRLVAADHLDVLKGVLQRIGRASDESLAKLPAFDSVSKRCQAAAGERVPHVRWFVEPFGYVEANRIANPDGKRRGNDMLKILKNTGFTAIQGIGGYVHLMPEKFEMLHQTYVYAPPLHKGEDRYELSANMLDFPNGGDFVPEAWVPREVATYASFNLKPKKVFASLPPLVDAIIGDEGVFEDVIKSIQEDPNGPQIDVQADLVNVLGGRATVISDYLLPITPKSERLLMAIQTTNPKKLADTIEKQMKTDPDAKRREYKEHIIWEIINPESDVAMVQIDDHPAFALGKQEEDENEEDVRERTLPNSAVTVAMAICWSPRTTTF